MVSTIINVHITTTAHSIDIALTTRPISPEPEPIALPINIDRNSTMQKVKIPTIM